MLEDFMFVPIYTDIMIKFLFGTFNNRRFLADFLEKCLYLEIGTLKDIEIINSIVLDKETVSQRKYELDIKARFPDGRLIDLEMQNKYNLNAEKRLFVYLTGLFYTQLRRSEDVDKLRSVTSIVLTKNLTIHKNNKSYQKFHMTNDDLMSDKLLSDLFETILIDIEHTCEYYEDRKTNKKLKNWLRFIKAKSLEELEKVSKLDPILMDAYKECVKFMRNDYVQDLELEEKLRRMEELADKEEREEQERQWKEQKRQMKEQERQWKEQKRQWNEQQKQMKEQQKQWKEQVKVAKSKGLYQGKFESQLEIAKNFLKTDIPLITISKCTGLSVEKLTSLKNDFN